MPERKIKQVHLSLIRTFDYQIGNPLEKSFSFLNDRDDYYEEVIKYNKYLSGKKKIISGVGQLRSVLDVQGGLGADTFFSSFQKYYNELQNSKLQKVRMIPHYPCVIDILPDEKKFYTFKRSCVLLKNLDSDSKISLSVRLYPIGLASLRLGCFLTSEKGFAVEDIIAFLKMNTWPIEVKDVVSSGEELDLRKYANKITEGIHKKNEYNEIRDWKHRNYSIVDIAGSTDPLTKKQDYKDIFLPLLCLNTNPNSEEKACISTNLSKKKDIFLIGPKSAVIYFPSSEKLHRRIVRRVLRDYIELLYMQELACNEISALAKSNYWGDLNSEYWKDILKNGIRSPNIGRLFSLWDYTTINPKTYPLKKAKWVDRYVALLKCLDQSGAIKEGNKTATETMEDAIKRANGAKKELGAAIKAIFEGLTKLKDIKLEIFTKKSSENSN